MLVGVPKEIKVHEYRVGLTPSSVREMKMHGHTVLVQTDAGAGIGATDDDYRRAGADIAASAEEVFKRAEMIVKVKEPQAIERAMLREGQILFTYLHLAPDPEQAADLIQSGAICIAYETVTAPQGGLPLLAPMSEVAGRLSVQAGARCWRSLRAASACLLGGVAAFRPAASSFLARRSSVPTRPIAVVTGAEVIVMDMSSKRCGASMRCSAQSDDGVFHRGNVEREVLRADRHLLRVSFRTPKLMTRPMLPAVGAARCSFRSQSTRVRSAETCAYQPRAPTRRT